MYIRITHRRKSYYLKTEWVVTRSGLGKGWEVEDAFVLESCSRRITEYIQQLNGVDVSQWSLTEVRQFLCDKRVGCSFSDFARDFIHSLKETGHVNNARLYQAALASLERHFRSEDVQFNHIDSAAIGRWLTELAPTHRARCLYGRCMRAVFSRAMKLSREPGSELPRIEFNPWDNVTIPTSETPRKRAIEVEECRRFFAFDVSGGKYRERLGRDMALLSFCLAGINTVDLYGLRKSDLRDGVIRYRRSKTSSRRSDGAYFEIRVPEMAAALIECYRAGDDSDFLLRFADRYKDARSFNAVVNTGIRRICERMGLRENEYSFYTFRHTWATVARNCCGASLSEVGFALNHIGGYAVTMGYIKPDFTPAWELNERVLAYMFPEEASAVDNAPAERVTGGFEVRPGTLVRTAAFAGGRCVAHFEDMGYGSVSEVLRELTARLPADLPEKTVVRIKVVDLDNGGVYSCEARKDELPR